jgi:hypothetical protein
MAGTMLALARSFACLAAPRIWRYILGPAAVALLLGLTLAYFWLGEAIATLRALPPLSWLVGWGVGWLATFFAAIAAWLAVLALTYLIATLIAAVFVMPLILNWLAGTEYRDVERRGNDGTVASLANSLTAVALYLGGFLLTLPLWLVPGAAFALPVFWLAWLNRRTFAFDAVVAHAGPGEWQRLRAEQSGPLLMLGVILALLACVPVLGLIAPTLAVLGYTHFVLEALRRMRQDDVIEGSATVIDREPI